MNNQKHQKLEFNIIPHHQTSKWLDAEPAAQKHVQPWILLFFLKADFNNNLKNIPGQAVQQQQVALKIDWKVKETKTPPRLFLSVLLSEIYMWR